jgi:membrane fusion protein, multidrug efflux system
MNIHRIFVVLLFTAGASAQQSIETIRVASRTVERKLTLPGEFSSYLAVDLYARVNGFVDRVDVDRGSVVRRGQILVALAAPELAAQVAEAKSKVAMAESQQTEAQAKLVAAQSTYERLKAAAATPGTVADNELLLAEKSMEALRSSVISLGNAVQGAKAAEQALIELESYLKVAAPFDGLITKRFVHPGALAGPAAGSASTPMLRIEQNTRLRLVVSVPEAEVGGTIPGARVAFTVMAHPGELFFGVVSRIPHSIDMKTRTMPVELDVSNPDLRLAPGMYAQVQWPVRNQRPSLLVPATSIVATNERQFVIRIKGGLAEWVNVARGVSAGDLVEVLGSLREGDLIVRRGTDELREGTRVPVP